MSITDSIEEKFGKIENLTPQEKQTFFSMLANVKEAQLTPEKLKDYVSSMKSAVEEELINEPEFKWRFIFKVPNRKQILLKARLKNYILLEAFLLSPERAISQLESMVGNLERS